MVPSGILDVLAVLTSISLSATKKSLQKRKMYAEIEEVSRYVKTLYYIDTCGVDDQVFTMFIPRCINLCLSTFLDVLASENKNNDDDEAI